MQRVFKKGDIVWRKMPLNDEVSYYVVTKDIIRPGRVSAVSLENGTEGIIDTNNLQHYWLQVGDAVAHNDEIEGVTILDIIGLCVQGTRLCVDVLFPSGTKGTFSVSRKFCSNTQIL